MEYLFEEMRNLRMSEQEIMRQSMAKKQEKINHLEWEVTYLKTLLRVRTGATASDFVVPPREPMKRIGQLKLHDPKSVQRAGNSG